MTFSKRVKLGNYVEDRDSIGSCLLPVYFVPPTLPLSQFSAYFGHSNHFRSTIAKLSMMSPVVINVPTRALLTSETMGFFLFGGWQI